MIWFTSDTHFGHANVLNFTDRPFGDIAHMNRALINAINERVAPTDDLYILGDFSYQMTAVEAAALRSKINCRKVHIVPGNHDKDWTHAQGCGGDVHRRAAHRAHQYPWAEDRAVALSAHGVAVHVARVLASTWAYPQRGREFAMLPIVMVGG